MSTPQQPPYPQQPYYPPPPAPPQPRNGFGITALVLGIVGAGFGLIPLLGLFALILGVLGLIFGIAGYLRTRKRLATNKGMSITGAVLGAIAIALGVWGMVIVGRAVNDVDNKIKDIDRQISSINIPPPPTT